MVTSLLLALKGVMHTQLFAGGMLVTLAGSLIAWGRNIPTRFMAVVKRRFMVQVDIVSTDPLFGYFSRWLNDHPSTKKSKLLTASMNTDHGRSLPSSSDDDDLPPVYFTPAPGTHLLWVGGRPMTLTRERKEIPGKGEYGGFQETFTIRAAGRSSGAVRKVLEDARDLSYEREKLVEVYALRYGDWRSVMSLKPRPISSIFLRDGQLERIVADLQGFLAAEPWYNERGIPWRRGHMYEGPPGTGKSSIVGALAGHLRLNLYILSINDKGMTDEKLLSAVQDIYPKSILLLEDVDAVVSGREVEGDSGVTFAGLLNALDGVTSKPGVVTIMTTNHPERLDPALVRKGRVDLREHFGVATEQQAYRMFQHFYQGDDTAAGLAEAFAKLATGHAMATLQGAMLDNKTDPTGAMQALYETPLSGK